MPSLRAVMLGIAALAGTTSASVSLASFTPRIDNLPTQCANVYNSIIAGCVPGDFTSSPTSPTKCSSACVQGLVKITEAINRSCANVDVGETSIIGVFQAGLGIQALCPGVTVTIVSSSSSTTKAASPTSTQAPPPPPALTTTTPTPSTSKTGEAKTSSTSSGGLKIDPSATETFATSASAPATNIVQPGASSTAHSPAAKPSRAPNSQLSNSDSGGGSPFDVVATSTSSHVRIVDISIAALFATALLFTAYA